MDKASLRKMYSAKRKRLLTAEREELNRKVAAQFLHFPLEGVRFIHVFYPIAGKLEVDSLAIVSQIRASFPKIEFVLPKSNLRDHTLSHITWRDDTPLAMNSWGITEPETGGEVTPDMLDLVLIPLLAYDERGNRVGYGKGFYDRFLKACRPDAKKVGLSWFAPEKLIAGTDTHDVKLDGCVTPDQVYWFGKAT